MKNFYYYLLIYCISLTKVFAGWGSCPNDGTGNISQGCFARDQGIFKDSEIVQKSISTLQFGLYTASILIGVGGLLWASIKIMKGPDRLHALWGVVGSVFAICVWSIAGTIGN